MCGHISPRWIGKCPECNSWNSLVEELEKSVSRSRKFNNGAAPAEATKLSSVDCVATPRKQVRSEEFNRVLGGGIVAGSVTLIGGDPGIGKSTLMLSEGVALAAEDYRVLYVSGEESNRQIKLRSDRLGVNSDHFYLLAERDLAGICDAIDSLDPALVIVDSIQTIYNSNFESSPGTISQVRESALKLSQIAKSRDLPVFLIGHVTKDGYLAGPKVLEHMVDVLLHFEGDRNHFYRILRSVKNRFGSTREIGVFEMKQEGLIEVQNPSSLFLEQRKENISGSAVISTMEGTRPFLVEVQALVTPTSYGLPQRTSTGIDNKRLSLLLAVLEKRIGLRLGTYDVFVNAAGGARVDEPSADLGILTSVSSSFKDQIVEPDTVVIGEVGLGGEIRAVPQVEQRLDEAAKLGFKRALIPKRNAAGLSLPASMHVVPVEQAEDALEEVLR